MIRRGSPLPGVVEAGEDGAGVMDIGSAAGLDLSCMDHTGGPLYGVGWTEDVEENHNGWRAVAQKVENGVDSE
jgi:hypothetical protein